LKKENENIQKQLKAQNESNSKLSQEIKSLKEQIEKSKSSKKKSSSESDSEDENETKEQIKSLKEENEKIKSEVKHWKTQFQNEAQNGTTLNEKIKNLESQVKNSSTNSKQTPTIETSLISKIREALENAIFIPVQEIKWNNEFNCPTTSIEFYQFLKKNDIDKPGKEELLENLLKVITALLGVQRKVAENMEKSVLLFRLTFMIGLLNQMKKDIPKINFQSIQNIKKISEKDADTLGAFGIFVWGLFQTTFEVYKSLIYSVFKNISYVSPKNVQHILPILTEVSSSLQEFRLSPNLYTEITRQIVGYVDIHIFNSFLDDPQLCSAGYAVKLKMQISQIETGLAKENKVLKTFFLEGLSNSRELVNLLSLDKSMVSDPKTAKEVFPHLNVLQMKTLLQQFKPDNMSPDKIDPKVIQFLETEAKKQSNLKLKLTENIGNPNIF